ncbi:MAG: DUF1786 domain-containing protein [Chloroflexota bacterium]
MLVAAAVRDATATGRDLLLTGVTMGGGPCHWAVEAHLKAGYRVFATPRAARTFDDDLEMVARMGIAIVAEDESTALRRRQNIVEIAMRDFWLPEIMAALAAFGVDTTFGAAAVAVFDHGAAPPGYSDRRFRFDYLTDLLSRGTAMTAFAHLRDAIPPRLTRLRAVADSAPPDLSLLLMDTGAAAVLGALEDPRVAAGGDVLLVNAGNFHTLAFRLLHGHPCAVFEHHTGLLTTEKLDTYLDALRDGTLTNEAIFADSGHGALILPEAAPVAGRQPDLCAVTGPRRGLLAASRWSPYFAVPHGHMMLSGCYGLLRALAGHLPEHAPALLAALDGVS